MEKYCLDSQSWIPPSDQINLGEAVQKWPPLGLRLSRTPSFLEKVDKLVQGHINSNSNPNVEDKASYNNAGYAIARLKSKDLQTACKIKAENFPISLLRIGSWQRVSRNEGDLVAKCYFAKKKLVWEFLEKGLKSKIEIQWSDILSLKAVTPEDQPGILEIELNQPPSFHNEIDPQPRKHTQWRMATDFTGGQAPTFRRHYLEFPPGALDRPLDKLLKSDSRLFQMSQQAFPTLESPYFQRHSYGIDLSFEFGRQGPLVNPTHQQQFSFSNLSNSHNYVSQHYHTYTQTTTNSLSAESPISDEKISNNNPVAIWGQGMNNVRDSLVTTQVGGIAYAAAAVSLGSQINSTIPLQKNHMQVPYLQEATRNQLEGLVPTPPISSTRFQSVELQQELQDMLLSNSHAELANQVIGDSYESNTITANYGQDMVDNNDIAVMNNNWSNHDDRQIYSENASWMQSQVLQDNMSMDELPAGNNITYYPSVVSDPATQYFPSDHNFNNWSWKS